jgi:hypothetical protein
MRRFAIALSFFITQAFGTTYYVSSSSGSDSNSGTSTSSPWKTVTKVNARSYSPGDFILFKRGDTWVGSNFSKTLTTTSAGISGKQITYGDYGSGAAPVLEGNNVIGTGIHISRNYVTINGFQIRNVTGVFVDYTGTTGSNILNIAGTNAGVWGYRAGSGAGNTLIDHTSCTITSGHSMRGWCYQAVGLGSIKITNSLCDLSQTTSGACMEIFGSSTSVIQYNTSHGGSQAFSLKSMGGTGCTGPAQTGGLIADNYADGVSVANGDGEDIEMTGCPRYPQSGVTVARNVIVCKTGRIGVGGSNAIGSYYSQNDNVYGNIVMGGCQTGTSTSTPRALAFNANSINIHVYNNTIVGIGRGPDNRAYMAMLFPPGSNGIVKNNIVKHYPIGISGKSTEDYNIFDTDVTTPYQNGVSHGGHSRTKTSPQFVSSSPVRPNDVKLQATSPAIRKGTNLGSSFNSILNPLGVVSPFGVFDQSLGWMVGAFGY